jgi:hypothetical protein
VQPALLAFIGVGILVVALVAVLAYVSWLAQKRRREAFRALAAQRGWEFTESDAQDRPDRYAGWSPFGEGSDRVALNAVRGKHEGLPFDLFTYRYTTTTRGPKGQRRQQHHHFRIVAATMAGPAPDLRLSRETFGKKLWDALGGEDIDFESDEFSRRFWVKCKDRRFAYDCIDARMMEYLLAQPAHWSWRWDGRTLLMVRPGVLEPAEALEALAFVQVWGRMAAAAQA